MTYLAIATETSKGHLTTGLLHRRRPATTGGRLRNRRRRVCWRRHTGVVATGNRDRSGSAGLRSAVSLGGRVEAELDAGLGVVGTSGTTDRAAVGHSVGRVGSHIYRALTSVVIAVDCGRGATNNGRRRLCAGCLAVQSESRRSSWSILRRRSRRFNHQGMVVCGLRGVWRRGRILRIRRRRHTADREKKT